MSSSDFYHSLLRPEVLALSAYHVADATGLIKLDAMENPYSWPDKLKAAWWEELQNCSINRYPDPTAQQLLALLKQQNGIADNLALLLGNGSDELIQILLMALKPDATVLSVQPGFVMYQQIARSLGLSYQAVNLQAGNFDLPTSELLAAIAEYRPTLIFLAYPNNPTGNLFDRDSLHEIIKAAPGLVIIDEAYAPFAKATFMAELPNHPNLMVMRTVSKLGLAGLRLGYLAGKADLISELNKIRLPYNINCLTQLTTEFALRHFEVFAEQTEIICMERDKLLQMLSQYSQLTVYPSAANFILFKTPSGQATEIFNALKQQGILIKNLSSQGGLLTDCLRVTVGKPEENQAFLSALNKVISSS